MNKNFIRKFSSQNKVSIKKAAVIALIIAVAFVVFALDKDENTKNEMTQRPESTTEDQREAEGENKNATKEILVDVSGAVSSPSVVRLPSGSRVYDAIKAAGGLKKNADVSGLNQAAFVNDGEKVSVAEKVKKNQVATQTQNNSGTVTSTPTTDMNTGNSSENISTAVNINTADSTQLQTLNGVGPATAEKIIDYREKNGPFTSKEDIKNVKGIGDKTYEKLKDSISI